MEIVSLQSIKGIAWDQMSAIDIAIDLERNGSFVKTATRRHRCIVDSAHERALLEDRLRTLCLYRNLLERREKQRIDVEACMKWRLTNLKTEATHGEAWIYEPHRVPEDMRLEKEFYAPINEIPQEWPPRMGCWQLWSW